MASHRNFIKAFLYDSVIKSLLIILDECLKSREHFAVERTRRFGKEFEMMKKLQQSENEAFERKLEEIPAQIDGQLSKKSPSSFFQTKTHLELSYLSSAHHGDLV